MRNKNSFHYLSLLLAGCLFSDARFPLPFATSCWLSLLGDRLLLLFAILQHPLAVVACCLMLATSCHLPSLAIPLPLSTVPRSRLPPVTSPCPMSIASCCSPFSSANLSRLVAQEGEILYCYQMRIFLKNSCIDQKQKLIYGSFLAVQVQVRNLKG